jgi:putative transposase
MIIPMPDYHRLYQNGGTYFFTVVTYRRNQVFLEDDAVALLNDCFEITRRDHPFTIDAYVILPDHLHMIWTLPETDCDFSMRWNLIKGNFSRRYGTKLESLSTSRQKKREKSIWQRRFWEHLVRDQNDFNRLCDYIHYNPVKHGLVKSPGAWRHSTFRDFRARGLYPEGWGFRVSQELDEMVLE